MFNKKNPMRYFSGSTFARLPLYKLAAGGTAVVLTASIGLGAFAASVGPLSAPEPSPTPIVTATPETAATPTPSPTPSPTPEPDKPLTMEASVIQQDVGVTLYVENAPEPSSTPDASASPSPTPSKSAKEDDAENEKTPLLGVAATITLTDAKGKEHTLTLCQKWPIRTPRPSAERMTSPRPLITGQRVIDTMFPLAKGGAAAIPGGFGTGKTMTQHQIAKWCDADIIIYVGCGERGNEMTQALQEFSELVDPRTGKSLMDRTVLIANTSNMPVAAREASIYTGITLAEYYRDMGYHAAMMADSTSRWAEALREISGRLEEMPADEGYPAYLPSRLAEFYERAGYVKTLNGAEGSVSVIGAVSPQGNDFSEPVTQNTKRFTRCFWALDKSLAYARHYPAINWNDSYSEYLGDLGGWYYDNVGHDFMSCRERIANLLLQENNLMQIVKLIGSDVLPDDQKLTIEIARVIRVGFLQQNAFHAVDTYVPLEKQLKMMETILYLYDKCAALVAKQVPVSRLLATGLFDELVQMKYTVPNDDFTKLDELQKAIDTKLAAVAQG